MINMIKNLIITIFLACGIMLASLAQVIKTDKVTQDLIGASVQYENLKEALTDNSQNTSISRVRIVNKEAEILFRINDTNISWDYPSKLDGEYILEFLNQLEKYTLTPSDFTIDKQTRGINLFIENGQDKSMLLEYLGTADDGFAALVIIDRKKYKVTKIGMVGNPLIFLTSSKERWEDLTYLGACPQKIKFISKLEKYNNHIIDSTSSIFERIKKLRFYQRLNFSPVELGNLISNVEVYYNNCNGKPAHVEKHKYFQRIIDGTIDENYFYIFANGVFYRAQYFSWGIIL